MSEDTNPEGQESTESNVADLAKIKIANAFEAAVSEDKGEDEIKMSLIGAGATFKNVARVYNQLMIDGGFAVSKAEKDEIVGKILAKAKIAEEEGFDKTVAAIVEKAAGVNAKSAASLIRAWAKAQGDEGVECYSKPKGTGGERVGFRSRFFDALLATPSMTKEACAEYLKTAEGTSNNVMKHESVYQGIRQLVNSVAASLTESKAA